MQQSICWQQPYLHPPLQTANNYTAACDIDNCKGVIYNNCMSKLRIRDELDACTTYVFVSKVLPANSISILYPPQRQQQIDQCQSAKVRAEKYTSWKLLEKWHLSQLHLPLFARQNCTSVIATSYSSFRAYSNSFQDVYFSAFTFADWHWSICCCLCGG